MAADAVKDQSVDDMAAAIARRLKTLKTEQAAVVADRSKATDRLKVLAVEIDKAERMTRAFIPRTRATTKPAAVTASDQGDHKVGRAAEGARS